ncbi:hypothetical protein B9G55_24065 [Saccharibacillus sp. O16]|nr:hypothetical protein B9G55_24065 [Saccharibacillus sp. O16]
MDEAVPAGSSAAGGQDPSGAVNLPDSRSSAAAPAEDAPQPGASGESSEADTPKAPRIAGASIGAAAPAAGAAALPPAADAGGSPPEDEVSGEEASASETLADAAEPPAEEPTTVSQQTLTAPKAAAGGSSSKGDSKVVNLTFAGDVIFSGKVQSLLEKEGYDYPYTYVKNRFKNDDLTVINLETPVTSLSTTGADKSFVFKSPPKALTPLKNAGVDVVNLANNHTLDQGIKGLLDTITNLDQVGLAHVGAGKDADAAYAPVYVERKGIKIAIVGVTRVLPDTKWAAGKNHPGAASAYDTAAASRAVSEAKKKADLVVAIVHWGKERVDMPDANQKTLAHALVDAGADLTIGGHAHVLQGFEQYKGKWIAYGTGNFIFTHSATAKTWETGVFQAECTKDGQCSMKLVPYWAELGQPVPMKPVDAKKLLKRIEGLSPGVKIDAEGRIQAK